MERDPLRTAPLPSVEEQVNRVIKAGEQARSDAAHELEHAADKADSSVGSMAQQATNKAKELVSDLRSKDASEIASDVKDKASELGAQAKDKAGELGAQAADKADAAMTATGERMESLAQTVRDKAPEGKVGEMATSAANALERGGNYLQQADLTDVRGDLESFIRRRPVESLLVGLGVGFLLARALRR